MPGPPRRRGLHLPGVLGLAVETFREREALQGQRSMILRGMCTKISWRTHFRRIEIINKTTTTGVADGAASRCHGYRELRLASLD